MRRQQDAARLLAPVVAALPLAVAPHANTIPLDSMDETLVLAGQLCQLVMAQRFKIEGRVKHVGWSAVTGNADVRMWAKEMARHRPHNMDQVDQKLSKYASRLCRLPHMVAWLTDTGFPCIIASDQVMAVEAVAARAAVAAAAAAP